MNGQNVLAWAKVAGFVAVVGGVGYVIYSSREKVQKVTNKAEDITETPFFLYPIPGATTWFPVWKEKATEAAWADWKGAIFGGEKEAIKESYGGDL